MMRQPSEDELADYREQAAIERWEKAEARHLADKAWREWYYPWERVSPDED